VKTAIFVEGQTEVLLIRDFLEKTFQYSDLDIECYQLVIDGNHEPTNFSINYPGENNHFRIIDVGGDGSVLSNILNREVFLRELGYTKILGLKDMYSAKYKERCNGVHNIYSGINTSFINGSNESIVSY
jgi:hypothetical protein